MQNTMNAEAYDNAALYEEAISVATLANHMRSFLIKLNVIESQLGVLPYSDSYSFAVVLELRDGKTPTPSKSVSYPLAFECRMAFDYISENTTPVDT
jgi:mitotic spindle assembly checkpoint protein MAD2B